MLVDGHSGHSRATVVGGGVLTTAVDEMIKQPGIKLHGIKAKLNGYQARTGTHRGALATVRRT